MTFRDRRGTLVLEGEGTNFKDKLLFFEGVNLVGRNPAKTNVTIKDRSISQIHAKIICKDHTIKIVDAKSKNGVYLNNLQNPIQPDAEIQINPKEDIVYFAQIKCRFQPDWIDKENEEDTRQFTVKTFKPNTKANEAAVNVVVQDKKEKQQQKDKVQLKQNKNSKKEVQTKEKNEKNQQSLKINNKQTKKQQQLQKIAKQKQKDELLKAILAQQQTLNQNSVIQKNNNQKMLNQKSKQSKNDEKTQGAESKQIKKKSKKQSKEKPIKNTQKQKTTKDKQKGESKQNSIVIKQEIHNKEKSKEKQTAIQKKKQEEKQKQKQKQETKKQKNKEKVSKKTSKEQENQKKEGKTQKSVDTKQKESKQMQKIQNQIKQQKQKLSKLQKRGDSNQTKVKGKNKRITKSAGKNDETQENKKKFPNKKKLPETLNSSFSSHPKRAIVTKKVLLSCFRPVFTPLSRIVLIENWRQPFDVLVMQKFSRTFKLLYTICLGIPVVSNSWIIQCEHRRGIASFERFYLQCPQKDLIQNSIAKVKAGNKVFDKLKFYLIQPQSGFHLPMDQIQALIDVGGGTIIKKLGKKDDIKQIIFIMKLQYGDEDIKALKKIQGAEKIYTIEMIMDSCLHQQIKWSENTVSKL